MKMRWVALVASLGALALIVLLIVYFSRGNGEATPTPVPATATSLAATATVVAPTPPASAPATATLGAAATPTPLALATALPTAAATAVATLNPATATATIAATTATATKAPATTTPTATAAPPTATTTAQAATATVTPAATAAATPVIATSSATLVINGQTVAYSYPSGWQLKQETKDNYTVVTLRDADDNLLTLTIYGTNMEPSLLSKTLLDKLSKAFSSERGGTTNTPLTGKVGGTTAEGYTMKFTHQGLPMTGVILSWRSGKSSLTMYTQAADEDLSAVQPRFDVVKNTLVVR